MIPPRQQERRGNGARIVDSHPHSASPTPPSPHVLALLVATRVSSTWLRPSTDATSKGTGAGARGEREREREQKGEEFGAAAQRTAGGRDGTASDGCGLKTEGRQTQSRRQHSEARARMKQEEGRNSLAAPLSRALLLSFSKPLSHCVQSPPPNLFQFPPPC
jgi:hypothetical protein